MFIIIYSKIYDNKKDGLELDGPFLGPEAKTMEQAHKLCEELVSSSKIHTLVRIYDLEELSEFAAKEKAKACFDIIYNNMVQAAEILERPARKRKKRNAY